MKIGMVYLVGAGPGDPGLLTLKGRDCLSRAQVVVYDRLVNRQLLRYAPPEAELIYVGKAPGGKAATQQEINALLTAKAKEGKVVVRLKGGDPFVFGRGGEEAEALAERGVPFAVIPGVTAAVAVPAYAGIPVTHRRLSSTLTVLTGYRREEAAGETEVDDLGPKPGSATLVFLMGRQNLAQICARLVQKGWNTETPVAVIERGTTADQRTVVATLATVEGEVVRAGVSNPMVMVVGPVVRLREALAWREKLPLFGRRIVITRARHQAESLRQALEELGAEVWEFPLLEVVPPTDFASLGRAVEKAAEGKYHWLVFTSANGVRAFFESFFARGKDARDLAGTRIAVIGKATGRALREWGLRPDLVPDEYRAEGLLAAFAAHNLTGQRVLLARAEIARPVLATGLRQRGAEVEEVVAYRIRRPEVAREELQALLLEGRIHALTLTSPSTARHFWELFTADTPRLLERTVVAAIGPVTAEAARRLGISVEIEAREYTVKGLVQALSEYWTSRPSS
ncbi:MAG: uroporphyrinogen-III C-methyltransferase [Moorellales bacterium]